MRFRRKYFAKAVLFVLFIAAVGWVVMRLYNWVVPGLFVDAQMIDYPRALGLLVLCRILFGGFRARGGRGGCHGGRHWQRWQRMTPEEREQLRDKMSAASRGNPESGL
ncbi:hypothetical protein [Caballeronia sp. LZ034LL]|uniref:hypothetical protein n=1 Tax=Caballeronia sp. LZ034LL TaxID=3038567 RepID=UPI00285DE6A7|nr:hypothetical protein [Caballeronia sp. LZ034LL]MDR5836596.1 hypothetical protein [Caballeronia sp. LZ034LL]